MQDDVVINRRKSIAGTLIMYALIILTISLILRDQSLSLIVTSLRRADPVWIAAGFLLMFVFINCEAAISRMLLKSFGLRVGWLRSLCYSLAGFYFSAITPSATGGQPMQAYYMKRDGIGLSRSSFTLMVVSSFYQAVILIYGCVMYVAYHDYIRDQFVLIRWMIVLGITVNGGCSLMLLSILFHKKLAESMLKTTLRFLRRLHLVKRVDKWNQKIDTIIQEYNKGGEYLKRYPLVAVKAFALTIVQVTAANLIPMCVCLAMGLSGLNPVDFLARQSLLSLAVSAIPLPGSIGASEGTFILLYGSLLAAPQVAALVILSRGISFYAFLLISGAVVLYLGHSRRRGAVDHGKGAI